MHFVSEPSTSNKIILGGYQLDLLTEPFYTSRRLEIGKFMRCVGHATLSVAVEVQEAVFAVHCPKSASRLVSGSTALLNAWKVCHVELCAVLHLNSPRLATLACTWWMKRDVMVGRTGVTLEEAMT